MSMELANTIVREAVAACFAEGYNVSTAVVGRAGVLRALLHADNTGLCTPKAVRQKAYISSSRIC
ncbi:heme-binding protein [Brucella sp. C7-11G]